MPVHTLTSPILDALRSAIVGKEQPLRLVVASLLAGGHILLEDVPGVGKTLLARTLAQAVGGEWKRVQFSSDLLPSDITGVRVFHPGTGAFRFAPGPLFAHVLLADEINRASPRTQSSLLEAMEEGRVTVDGETHALPEPFLVIATQNPMEHHGTFPLPEAQLDRFAISLSLGYPSEAEEIRLLARSLEPVASESQAPAVPPGQILVWREQVRQVRVDPSLQAYIVKVAHATRRDDRIALGVSPRGSLLWLRLAQAIAWMEGRHYVVPDDLYLTAVPVLAHRLVTHQRAGQAARRALIEDILSTVPVPD
jgi:MoxR-like ATPase